MRKNRLMALATATTLAVSATFLAGCNAPSETDPEAKPKVLTTFTILADMAQNVAGEHLDVQSITSPNQEIHEYAPTPNDIKRAEGAQLVLNNGLGLEKWFEKFVGQTGAKTVVVTEGIEPIPVAEGDYEGKPNPHAWMSPTRAQIYVDNMAKAFAELDPEHQADYEKNAADYKQKLQEVDQYLKSEIATVPENQRVLVSCEGAFSYLAQDTGLLEKYLWGVNGEGALTPKRVADVEAYVRENQVPAVFCESTVTDKMTPIVQSTGAKFGGTLYVDSLSDEGGDVPTFLDLLKYDAELIAKGLTGK